MFGKNKLITYYNSLRGPQTDTYGFRISFFYSFKGLFKEFVPGFERDSLRGCHGEALEPLKVGMYSNFFNSLRVPQTLRGMRRLFCT